MKDKRHMFLALVVVLALLPAFAGAGASHTVLAQTEADWPMAGANPQRTSWTPEEVRGALHPIWYRPIEPYISPKVQVIASHDRLYVSTARGLYAFHTGTGADGEAGELAWIYPTELPLGHSPSIADGVVYVGGLDHKLHAIDALTGQGLWTFEADAGFQTNPLVVNGIVYAGNRDGAMYAVYGDGYPNRGTPLWSYQTGGPILYSAAYDDGNIYFASNDSYAYALNAQTGQLVWKSAKLPGSGFHSWWPVVWQGKVVFSGGQNYRTNLDPFKSTDLQGLERDDLYAGMPDDQLLGERSTNPPYAVTATPQLEYYENKPWRRTVFVLNAETGQEVTVPYQRSDGTTGSSYAFLTWYGTHGTQNRYPPVVGTDGRLYYTMHYASAGSIPRGHIVGWDGLTSFTTPSSYGNAMDEPMAYSAGGNVIYWNALVDRRAAAFDYTLPNPNLGTGFGPRQLAREWFYWMTPTDLANLAPGYDVMYHYYPDTFVDPAVYGNANGVYGRHGDQSPFIPYKGRLYILRSNSLMAFGNYTDDPLALPLVQTVDADNGAVRPLSTSELKVRLSAEVRKMLDAGHLRPGYISHGLVDSSTRDSIGDYLFDYWHSSSDTLYTLLLALPHLSAGQQQAVRTYLENEYAAYPPYLYTHIGWQDGESREAFDLPPEVEADRANHPPQGGNYAYEGWAFPPHMFYALWKYAEEFGDAAGIFQASRNRLEAPPADDYLIAYPYVHNAYIAGYVGYLNLERLATGSETPAVRQNLNRLLALRASTFSKDSPWASCPRPGCEQNNRVLNIARNFMYLVPELGDYLRANKLAQVQAALDEYNVIEPSWFVTKQEQTRYEGVVQPLYDASALFLARAMILQQPRSELAKYLDVPAFQRGDLAYIQNLVLAIEAAPPFEKMAHQPSGLQGDPIEYTLSFSGVDSTLTMTDTLPAGLGAPFDVEVSGSSIAPVYDAIHHRLTWSDVVPDGQDVVIHYTAVVLTGESQLLVNTAELVKPGGVPGAARAMVIANPLRICIPLVLKHN